MIPNPKPKIKAVFCLLMLPLAAIAQDWLNGDAKFTPKSNRPRALTVTWWAVPNIQAACEAESKRRGLGGFGYGVDACSFWSATQCIIVTSTRPTMNQLGHEARHCFEHSFHP